MPATRKLVKVPLFGQINKAAKIEDGATVGAQIGVDLLMPDGSIATLAKLAAAVGSAGTSTSAPGTSTISATIWSLIAEIPPNVVQVAGLSTSGLVVRRSTGAWITRAIAVASTARLTIANGDGDAGAPTLDMADVTGLSVWGKASSGSGKPAPIASSADDTFPQRTAGVIVWGGLTLPMIPASLITYAKLQDASAVSVLGRSANSAGVLADIVAAADDRLLTRVAGAIAFTQLTAGMFPASLTLATAIDLTKEFEVSGSVTGVHFKLEDTASGDVTLTGGTVNTTANGGGVTIAAGAGGFTSGQGGTLVLRGGANGDSSPAGTASLEGGRAFGTGTGGAVGFQGGKSDSGSGGSGFFYSGDGVVHFGDLYFGIGNAGGLGQYTALQIVGDTHAWKINGTAGTSGMVFTSKGASATPEWTLPTSPGYTVATLPAGTIGDRAYVTDALAPAFLAPLVGLGAVVCPAFFDGTQWVAG